MVLVLVLVFGLRKDALGRLFFWLWFEKSGIFTYCIGGGNGLVWWFGGLVVWYFFGEIMRKCYNMGKWIIGLYYKCEIFIYLEEMHYRVEKIYLV